MKLSRSTAAVLLIALLSGCAALGGLGQVIQAPRFAVASGQDARLRLLGPSSDRPLGGVAIRLWARVENPNPLGLTLSRLQGALALEGSRAADVDFPLGLPLRAAQDTVIPLDIAVSFSNLPGLAEVVSRAVTRGSVAYHLNGTVRVDAGVLGQPAFGPMTLLEGSVRTRQ